MPENNFYATFTDRFRGPRGMVKQRLAESYRSFVEPLGQLYPRGGALDLGCGRGEWLELLAEQGLEPRGVDLDETMLDACRSAGFAVEKRDAVDALLRAADGSLAAISGFHIIEHIPFEALHALLTEALRALKPGGLLILETPNPENILVSTTGFYLDPTHRRPIPLHLLAFLAEHTGFARIKVLRLNESPEIAGKFPLALMDVLDGVSPDYAVVAQKQGDEAQMAATSAAFVPERGVMLDALTARYDQQITQTTARVGHLETCFRQLEARSAELETRVGEVAARAATAAAELQAIQASRSWRITRPLRLLAEGLHRVRARLGLERLSGPGGLSSGRKALPRKSAADVPVAVLRERWRHERDFVPVARMLARPAADRPRQLFVDISAIVQIDAKTGIQRVTRSLLKELFENPPAGYRIEPVYATPARIGYRYARQYAAQMLNLPPPGKDTDIEYGPFDVFLGVDLQHRTLIAQRDYLMELRRAGVSLHFVVYDLLPILMPQHFVLEPDIHQAWLEVVTAFDGVLCISRAVAGELHDWIGSHGRRRVSPFRIEWFHLGADIENSVPTTGLPADAESVLESITRNTSFLMVGTLEPRKGHRQTLDAFEQLWNRGVDASLVLVGQQGWQVEALIARIRQHPELGRRLFWLNYISDAYLEKVYAASACLIAASEGEGFGLPLIEAARHRLPIIARGIPVFKEVAGEHALYFDGLRPADLAAAIEHWLALAGRGAAPPATGMQWLTWTESIGQLKQKLLGYPLRDTWYDAEQPDVSLIVLNYNKPAMTLACIESLWRQTQGYRYEIVLVDNGSTPENVMALAPAEAGARIVRTGVNRYFGEGNNLGCEAARGRYVVFLNNDIIATPGWLEPLIRRLENDPGIGATGPQLVSPDGRLQEAGAEIGATGDEQRYGRDADPFDPAYAVERDVMYASAAALAMRKDTFERVLGFDLYYEPAYYEDCDLCLKIRQLGLKVLYCPDARIIHIENATSMDQMGDKFKLKELVMLNRGRFLARWQPVLEGKVTGIEGLLPPPAPPLCVRQGLPAVLIHTPYPLLPGGGERYLLTAAAAIAVVANVTLATPHPYSRLRLRTMARELSLDLDTIRVATLDQATRSATYDIQLTIGNEALPGIPGKAARNVYICQFPFPAPRDVLAERARHAADYTQVVVYSPFVRRHYERALQALGVPLPRIDIVSPPAVLARNAPGGVKKTMILGVGRFFTGGHAKRHDLMIAAFKKLVAHLPNAELHLAGTVLVEPEFRAYFAKLQRQAEGLPVHFHPNAAPQKLAELYREASLYWHLAGHDVDPEREPHRCEHFGITVVEAMSAGCIPLVTNRGGPPEIIRDGVTGYVFATLDDLVARSTRLLSAPAADAGIAAMRAAAIEASQACSPERFAVAVRDLLGLPQSLAAAKAGGD